MAWWLRCSDPACQPWLLTRQSWLFLVEVQRSRVGRQGTTGDDAEHGERGKWADHRLAHLGGRVPAAELSLQLDEHELRTGAVGEDVLDDLWILDGIQEGFAVNVLADEAFGDVLTFVHV